MKQILFTTLSLFIGCSFNNFKFDAGSVYVGQINTKGVFIPSKTKSQIGGKYRIFRCFKVGELGTKIKDLNNSMKEIRIRLKHSDPNLLFTKENKDHFSFLSKNSEGSHKYIIGRVFANSRFVCDKQLNKLEKEFKLINIM